MGNFKINEKDLFFIVKEQLNYGSLCSLDRYRELDTETLDMLVTEAVKFGKGVLEPLQNIGEKWGIVFENGKIQCSPEFKEAFRKYANNGWIAVARDTTFGGQGFPRLMRIVVNDIMYGAAQAFNMSGTLTHGAGHLIENFASDELKEQFVPRMYKGEWTGTMCLTEADAGSNLGAVKTTAFRNGDNFSIKGTKTFISWGEHDLTENIVHLVLARIKGAPDGIRGLSLFIVPKIRVNSDGFLGESNDVICSGAESKLGLHACPTCVLNFGENDRCIGWLCGEENRGMAHMFQMVNAGRINVALAGLALASTAYQNALAYAKERIQGHDLAGRKSGYVPIIEHPDIRRMLLWMKAMVEGMRSMIYAAAYWSDLAFEDSDIKRKRHYEALTDFMTPILKAYCADMSFNVCAAAMQCLGGYGYCKEYPLEQYLRDSKILSLFEGTNGIQSMDLMGRKMRINGGEPFEAYVSDLEDFCHRNNNVQGLREEIGALSKAAKLLAEVALVMKDRVGSDPLQWGSYTYPALLCFGDVTIAWRLLDMALIAKRSIDRDGPNDYYMGKVIQATYFMHTILPLTVARLSTCVRGGREIVEMPEKGF